MFLYFYHSANSQLASNQCISPSKYLPRVKLSKELLLVTQLPHGVLKLSLYAQAGALQYATHLLTIAVNYLLHPR
jgi:hypothetical protein